MFVYLGAFLIASNVALCHGFDAAAQAKGFLKAKTPSPLDMIKAFVPAEWKGARISASPKELSVTKRFLREVIPEGKNGFMIMNYFDKDYDSSCEKKPAYQSASVVDVCYKASLEDGSEGSFDFIATDVGGGYSKIEKNIYYDAKCKSKKLLDTMEEYQDGSCMSLGEGFDFFDTHIYFASVSFQKGKKFKSKWVKVKNSFVTT